ncbi:hypothetical protein [Streptomyces winkii]|uniref:hypothetical protein n=1 Tax=Streptomyces winkii TaxID=3051178 RepID=UPI0028D76513|nr:hypothetical protein [Streptomyces sp. DSM 40971]
MDSEGDEQALALARHLVGRFAPEELELFEETAASTSGRSARRGRRRDDPLGFGVVEAGAVLFTSVACGVATEVVKNLAQETGEATAGRLRRWFRSRRRRPAGRSDELPDAGARAGTEVGSGRRTEPPDPRTLREIRELTVRRAVLLGLPPERAELLADSVTEYLTGPAAPSS